MRKILLVAALFSAFAQAQWIQTTGSASLEKYSTQQARSAAVNDAISQALLFSGLELSSVQTLTNGVLTQDQILLQANGQVRNLQLVSEQQSNGRLSVTIEADISSNTVNAPSCTGSGLVNHFALTHTALTHPQQALFGQIFDINNAFTKQLYSIMQQADLAMQPVPFYQQAFDVAPFFTRQYQYDERLIEQIRTQSNSQYVLLSQISDVSVGSQLNNSYAFWQDDAHQRYFNIEFALFDGLTFEKRWQEAYQIEAPWEFEKTTKVDVNSGVFWQSQYGRAITALSEQIMYDLNTALACLPTRGIIEHINNDQVIINLGQSNGLVNGQQLTLAHSSSVTTPAGKHLPRQVMTLYQVEISQLYQHSAVATSTSKHGLSNIQINDLVLIRP